MSGGGDGGCTRPNAAFDHRDAGDLGGNGTDWRAGRLGYRRLGRSRPIGALRCIHRGSVDRAVGRDAKRVNLTVRRIEEHERLAG